MNVKHSKEYISSIEAQRRYGYSASAFRQWANDGKIKVQRAPGGKRYYHIESLEEKIGIKKSESDCQEKKTILYARVNSTKQRKDLKRQIEFLQEKYPQGEVISDIGSGLNYNRKGIKKLLKRISVGDISHVAITYPDRLCRYGTELFEWIFEEKGIELLVLCGGDEDDEFRTEELGREILDICNFFTAKYNGRKAARYRKNRSEKTKNSIEIDSIQSENE